MSAAVAFEHPPKPRLTLRVGITGKRAIPEAEAARIHDSLAAVVDQLAAFLVTCRERHSGADEDANAFSQAPPLLRIISGMAEGADQIAAKLVTERYPSELKGGTGGIETRLAAILPFAQAEYEKDFQYDPNRPKGQQERTPEERDRVVEQFRKLLNDKATEAVLEIDDNALIDSQYPNARNLAYSNLRDVLLEHSDVLIAVSDDVDGGAGGTVDVIRMAVQSIQVIKISTTKPEIYLMRAAELDAPNQTPREDSEVKPGGPLPEKLTLALSRILDPPAVSAAPLGTHHAHEEFRGARARLLAYVHESWKAARFSWVFKAFRNALTVELESGERFWPKAWAAFNDARKKYSIGKPEDSAASLWPEDHDSFTREQGVIVRRVLSESYGWADALAVRYADVTRSAYITIAFLGAIAVLVGLLSLLGPEKYLGEIKIAALVIEGVVLLIAGLCLFRPAHHERWHQRMIEYRAIAELLRHQRFVYALGAADRLERTADRSWREPDAWVGWYVRAVLRELGVPSVRLSAEHRKKVLDSFLVKELTGREGQIAYNHGVAKRFELIDERLGRLVQSAFAFTVWAAFIGAVLLAALSAFHWFGWWGHDAAHCAVHIIKPYFTLIMAFVPALIAAVHGIRFQMEFKNTAERAAATERELQQIADDIARSDVKEPGRKYGLFCVRAANDAMSADLAGWSSVYRGKSPEPP